MTGTKTARHTQQIANWLLLGVAMTIIQIAIGGITRLSGSGLSITEWEVITGALPPMQKSKWLQEFDKYKQTPQYQLLNSDFSLSNFKFIYFWEWFHRLWARLLGVVFAIGFVYFLVTKKFTRYMVAPLLLLFVLGGLQGAVGWIMVQSGLVGDAVYVRPTKLALHFLFAMLLLCYTWWFALKIKVGNGVKIYEPTLYKAAILLLVLLSIQLGYGALMAGHKAATAAPTWPTINGYLLHPPGLVNARQGWLNYIDNKIAIHFIHRNMAYLLTLLTIWFAWHLHKKMRGIKFGKQVAKSLVLLIILQALLGIIAVLNSTGIVPNSWGMYEWIALFHQLTGISLLLAMVAALYVVRGKAVTVI